VTESAIPKKSTGVEQRSSPSPTVAWFPGTALLLIGLWLVADGGLLGLGWACCAVGVAFLLVGAVAQGVAWGMDIHKERHP